MMPLLATKLQAPPLPASNVPRERLIDDLRHGVPASGLTLIAAPAGYGKTTLLQQWAATTRMPVAWLSLDERDDEPGRFLRYLYAAWEAVQPELVDTPLGLLVGSMAPDSERVLAEFVNAANELGEHTALVLDDYHQIESSAIHKAVGFLIDHAPPRLHFVISSRAEPPLPLARYRARQQLLEVDANALAFTIEETDQLLRSRPGALVTAPAAAIQERTEGWAAGTLLAALALERRGPESLDTSIGGRNRLIADYLSDEVFNHLPEDAQQFMVQASILDALHAPLCEAVTGIVDGQSMLDVLERSSLFVAPLDDDRRWYRFHPIFGDFLRSRLEGWSAEQVQALHRRAARWYLDHDFPEHAFDHAVAGDAPAIAGDVLERYLQFKLNTGEISVLARWLDAIPAEWFGSYPIIGLARIGFLAGTGAFEECVRCVDDLERRVQRDQSPETAWQRAMVTAIQCFLACIQNDLPAAEMQARRALDGLRQESLALRAAIHQTLGDAYRRNGLWEQAKAAYLETLSFLDIPPFQSQFAVHSVHVYGALADLELDQGRLRAAADYWRTAIETIRDRVSWGRLDLPLTGWIYIRMAEVLYEFNELDSARDHLTRGLQRVTLGGDVRAQVAGCLVGGKLELAERDVDAAAVHEQRAGAFLENAPYPEWMRRHERLRLDLWLAQDQLRAAVNWADKLTEDQLSEMGPERDIAILALVRVLTMIGDDRSLARAIDLAQRLSDEAARSGRLPVEIEARALLATALAKRSGAAEAMPSLERALRLAEPEGFVRLFVDLGPPLVGLLHEARSRDVLPGYVETLLTAFDFEEASAGWTGHALPEPLTDREQEILELIAAGLSNPEIADQLYISAETVKKHAGNIYGKLAVHSRTEAATRARELNLLD